MLYAHSGVLMAESVSEKLATSGEAGTGQHYLLQLSSGLVIVLVCIVVLAWLAKRFNRLQSTSDGFLEIVSGLSVGARERIVLVKVGKKQILIGVAPGHVSALYELDGELDDLNSDRTGNGETTKPFTQLLAERINAGVSRGTRNLSRRKLRPCE